MSLPLIHKYGRLQRSRAAMAPQAPVEKSKSTASSIATTGKGPRTAPIIPVKPIKRPADKSMLRPMFRAFLTENMTPKRRGAGVRMMHVLDRLEAWGDSLGLLIIKLPHPRDIAQWLRDEGIQIYKGSGGHLRLSGWDIN